MKTELEMKPKGGRRPGAGRKKLDPHSETTGISVRVTEAQKSMFEELGGAAWLRLQLDSAIASVDTGARHDFNPLAQRLFQLDQGAQHGEGEIS